MSIIDNNKNQIIKNRYKLKKKMIIIYRIKFV